MYNNKHFSHDTNCNPHVESVATVNNHIRKQNVKAYKNNGSLKTPVGVVAMNRKHLRPYMKNVAIKKLVDRKLIELKGNVDKYGIDSLDDTNFRHIDCNYGFYAMKIGSHELPVRVLYRLNDGGDIELHMVYHKNSSESDSEYVKQFKAYAKKNK